MKSQLFSFRNLIILLLVLMIGLSGFLFYQKAKITQQNKAAKTTHKASLTVTTVLPDLVEWPINIKLQGEVYPWQEAIVSSEVSGLRIEKVYADVGQQVKRGELLVKLSDDTIKTAINKQLATVDHERAALSEAKSNADRAREIKDTGALSTQTINQYLIAEESAKANLALAEAELKNQQILLSQTKITSPDSGTISSRDAKLGTVVSAGSSLFTLIRQNRIEWRAEVISTRLSQISKGQEVTIYTPNGKTTHGTVRLVAPTIDNQSRKGLLYIDMPANSARPGMYLTGEVTTGNQTAITLPESAVTMRDGNAYVFEISEPKETDNEQAKDTIRSVKQIKVQLGRNRDTAFEILTDINPQSEFVASGGAFLNDGDNVLVTELNEAVE